MHTLSLDTFTDGGISFAVGAGGTLNHKTGASSFGNGSSISMLGGSVTNTGGGAFSSSGPGTISGYGNVSGLTSVVATGHSERRDGGDAPNIVLQRR